MYEFYIKLLLSTIKILLIINSKPFNYTVRPNFMVNAFRKKIIELTFFIATLEERIFDNHHLKGVLIMAKGQRLKPE